MDTAELIKNLERPKTKIDMVLDTDAYNEIDDQYAVAYMLKNPEKLNVKAIYAAPFKNKKSQSPGDGMEKSYIEILKVLRLAGYSDLENAVFKGSERFLKNENAPEESPAARNLAQLAMNYTKQNPLYVAAIGAITNIASAILINPEITENIVVVWLAGHAYHWHDSKEFNMFQDVSAARVVFGCGAPLVQLPCMGVVSSFSVSESDLRQWMIGKNPLCDYLAVNTIKEANEYADGKPWTRVIWDAAAIAWLLEGNFFEERLERSPIPEYDGHYAFDSKRHFIKYIYHVRRDNLVTDLFEKLTAKNAKEEID